jgi:hypothetical protein
MPEAIFQFLADTPLGEFGRYARSELPWFTPAMLVLHLMGVATIIGAASLVGLRLLGVSGRGLDAADVGSRMFPWIWFALPVMLATGLIVLSGGRGGRYIDNPALGLKMVCLVFAVALTLILHRGMLAKGPAWEASTPRGLVRLAGAAVFLLWAATLFAGRWIPYA